MTDAHAIVPLLDENSIRTLIKYKALFSNQISSTEFYQVLFQKVKSIFDYKRALLACDACVIRVKSLCLCGKTFLKYL